MIIMTTILIRNVRNLLLAVTGFLLITQSAVVTSDELSLVCQDYHDPSTCYLDSNGVPPTEIIGIIASILVIGLLLSHFLVLPKFKVWLASVGIVIGGQFLALAAGVGNRVALKENHRTLFQRRCGRAPASCVSVLSQRLQRPCGTNCGGPLQQAPARQAVSLSYLVVRHRYLQSCLQS